MYVQIIGKIPVFLKAMHPSLVNCMKKIIPEFPSACSSICMFFLPYI